jgi:hypothetical protein
MKLFPFDSFALWTEIPLNESIERLKNNIAITGWLDTRSTSKPFAGHFSDNRFKVIRTGMHGSTKPVFEGTLFSDGEGTRIEMRITIVKPFKVMNYIFLGLIGLLMIIGLIRGNVEMILGSFIVLICYLGIMKLFIMMGYDGEYYSSLAELKEILKCKK